MVKSVVILVRLTLSAKIELIQLLILSTRDPDCQNDIQLFLQQFVNYRVNELPIDT